MQNQKIIKKTEKFVSELLNGESTGHDLYHIKRVRNLAKKINRTEKGDELIVEIGSLLHDVCDRKIQVLNITDLEKYLRKLELSQLQIKRILFIIKYIAFSSQQPSKKSLELKIVQDADRLDALGAIGIARTFAYGGKTNRLIYDPEIKPELKMKKKDYRQRTAPSINHFYEKLLKLKDLMNTKAGKKIAEPRHKFLQTYLKQFLKEWNGIK
jgi:uncharacterized protein